MCTGSGEEEKCENYCDVADDKIFLKAGENSTTNHCSKIICDVDYSVNIQT